MAVFAEGLRGVTRAAAARVILGVNGVIGEEPRWVDLLRRRVAGVATQTRVLSVAARAALRVGARGGPVPMQIVASMIRRRLSPGLPDVELWGRELTGLNTGDQRGLFRDGEHSDADDDDNENKQADGPVPQGAAPLTRKRDTGSRGPTTSPPT